MRIKNLFYFANLSVAKKIYLLIAVAIIPIILCIFGSFVYIYNDGERGNWGYLENLTHTVTKNLDRFIDDKIYNLKEISKNEQIINLLSAQEQYTPNSSASAALTQIQNYISSEDSNNFLFVISKKGECLSSCDTLSKIKDIKDIKNHPNFKKALEGKAYVSPRKDTKTQTEFLISQPVISKEGEIIGVVILKLDEKYIWDEFLKLINDNLKTSEVFLIDDNNTMFIQNKDEKDQTITSSYQLTINNKKEINIQDTENTSGDIKQLLMQPQFAKQVINRESGESKFFYQPYNHRIYGYTISKRRWIIGVNVPDLPEQLFNMIKNIAFVVVVIEVITIAGAILLGNSISRPIRILTKTAHAIDKGDLEQVAEIANSIKIRKNDSLTTRMTRFDRNILINTSKRQDDLGQLTRVFIQMASRVKEREQNLQKQVEKLHIKIDHEKKMKEVDKLTENEAFENLKSRVNTLKNNRKNLSCIITE